MKKDNYKHFKNGDCIVCIKEGPCVFPNLFNDSTDGVRSELYKKYIVDRYLIREDGGIIYDALVLKGYTPLHDGKNFVLLSEFRKVKLNRLKRKLAYKKIFSKFGFVK
jgi:hypothetical protein